jgi:hypothetical protein
MYGPATYLKAMGLASRRAKKTLRLHPFVIEAALRRMGARRLTVDEQMVVLRLVSDPSKVNWPDWWDMGR